MVKNQPSYLIDTAKAVEFFNSLLATNIIESFLWNRKPYFMEEYTNVSHEQICDMLEANKNSFEPMVKFYKPWNPFSNAYAMTYTGNYKELFLNLRSINRPIHSIVGSIAHEWGHCFEYAMKDNGYSKLILNHGDNYKKPDTFQYWLGDLVQELAKGKGL